MSAFDHSPQEPDQLRDQLRRLFRHRAVIALGLLLGALVGGAVSTLGGEDYTATGEVVVRPIGTAPPDGGGVSADKQLSMGTERRIARSAAVADRAAEALGGGNDPAGLLRGLRVSTPPETHVLEFEYTADSPERAAQRVNAFVRAYLEHREDAAARRIDTTVTRLTEELKPLLDRRGELDRRIAGAPGGSTGQAAESEREVLTARIADLQGRITGLKSLDTTPGEVVREGEAPDAPSGPGTAVLLVVGAVVGLAAGLVAAWIRALLDPWARSADEVRGALRAPVLGTLPRRRGGAGTPEAGLEVGPSRDGDRVETYRTIALRTLRHQRLAEPGSLLVVSPGEDAEAAATAVNLAAALAETGRDVLLVEADPRSPRLAGSLPVRGAGRGTGRGADRGADRGQSAGDWPGGVRLAVDAGTAGALTLLPGRRVPDAARALNSPALARLLTGPDGRDEYVVVLTRPLLSHADGTAVAGLVRGVLVVCDPDATRRDDLERVRELVASAGGHLLGAVLHHGGRSRRWPGRGPDRTGDGAPDTPGDLPGDPEDTMPLKQAAPDPSGARPDTAYGSYGRYRRTGDDTTLRA